MRKKSQSNRNTQRTHEKEIKTMAVMINCATDWTYDMFLADAKQYNATPIKGVHCRKNASDREQFMTWFKNCARDFKAQWMKAHNNKFIADNYEYIGDAFKNYMFEYDCFSDYYKDTYGQRPHLDMWFYIHAIGLPMHSDVARLFCAHPIENAVEDAKRNREAF